ncbi:MAG: hypothetical protein JWL82_117 [Parcubacteria group bacterium]|nr:hypothetical protein [Parcubacteria group bacterium]
MKTLFYTEHVKSSFTDTILGLGLMVGGAYVSCRYVLHLFYPEAFPAVMWTLSVPTISTAGDFQKLIDFLGSDNPLVVLLEVFGLLLVGSLLGFSGARQITRR